MEAEERARKTLEKLEQEYSSSQESLVDQLKRNLEWEFYNRFKKYTG